MSFMLLGLPNSIVAGEHVDGRRACGWRRNLWVLGRHGDGDKKAGHTRLIYLGTYLLSVMGMPQTGISGASTSIELNLLFSVK